MSCDCKPNWDVRSKCEPECVANTLEEFNKCPERISTMLFWIGNQYNLYQMALRNDFSFLDKYKMSKTDVAKVIKLFMEDQMDVDESVVDEEVYEPDVSYDFSFLNNYCMSNKDTATVIELLMKGVC